MTTLSFPSTTFPAPPRLDLDVPEGWEPAQVPGAALAVVCQEPAGTFRPNIVVTLLDGAGGTDPGTALDAVVERVREHTKAVVGDLQETTISGVRFLARDVSFVDAEAGTLAQSHLIGSAGVGADGQAVLIQVTATFGAEHAAQEAQVIHAIVKSMTISEPA